MQEVYNLAIAHGHLYFHLIKQLFDKWVKFGKTSGHGQCTTFVLGLQSQLFDYLINLLSRKYEKN